jgi:hypothetical protein
VRDFAAGRICLLGRCGMRRAEPNTMSWSRVQESARDEMSRARRRRAISLMSSEMRQGWGEIIKLDICKEHAVKENSVWNLFWSFQAMARHCQRCGWWTSHRILMRPVLKLIDGGENLAEGRKSALTPLSVVVT